MRNYICTLNEAVERKHVRYNNRYGFALAGDLYTAKDMDKNSKYPAVVVGAPYGGVKEQGPSVYANELAKRGFVVLTFDPCYMGESSGEPRHVSSPDMFSENISAGVDYLGECARHLEQVLGRKVRMTQGRKTGRIELEYYDADDREALLQALEAIGRRN